MTQISIIMRKNIKKKLVFYKKIKNYNFTTETVKSWQNLQL